ncbi:MAG: hypothetical protein Kow0074_14200 [Candidatus Zixiibacteriota bacterium]
MRWRVWCWLLMTIGLVAGSLAWPPTPGARAAGDEGSVPEYDVGDVYFMIGEQPVWLGNRIRYTVYETCNVEARFITPSGEIIILLQLGEQEPGQYTLPWHTDPIAAAMAGLYTFELYFDDDYAVKTTIAVMPAVGRST